MVSVSGDVDAGRAVGGACECEDGTMRGRHADPRAGPMWNTYGRIEG